MERKHKERIFQKYGEIVSNKHIEILDIEDNFKYMDTELIEILELSVNPILERYA